MKYILRLFSCSSTQEDLAIYQPFCLGVRGSKTSWSVDLYGSSINPHVNVIIFAITLVVVKNMRKNLAGWCPTFFLRQDFKEIVHSMCREETGEHYSGPMDLSQIQNAHLEKLEEDMHDQLQLYPHSPFLLYVYGLVLSDRCSWIC